jgi:hypothetical protein
MTEDEMNAAIEREIDTKLAAELEARKAKMRADIAVRMRREAGLAHLDKVNAKAPIEGPLAGLTPEQDAARRAGMAERTRAANERMDAANARPVPGAVVRGSLRPTRADSAGGVGFKIKCILFYAIEMLEKRFVTWTP